MTQGSPVQEPGTTRAALERAFIILVAAHSAGIGLLLMCVPLWSIQLGGWEVADPVFFVRQGGAFHLVVAVGYLLEYHRCRGITLLVTAKCLAVLFLGASFLLDPVPWAVPAAAAGDGAIAVVALLLHRHRG